MSRAGIERLKLCFVATRPWSFTMTGFSVAAGCVLAVTLAGRFSLSLALVTLLGAIAAHAATNLINDYFDTKNGVDREGAPNTLYRPHPLLTGIFTPAETMRVSVALYAAAAVLGAYLAVVRGWPVAAIALAGGIVSVAYTAGPVELKYHGLGEVVVFLVWGPLMTMGSYFTQTGSWHGAGTVFWVSVPLGIWVALVLLANNLKDLAYDSATGIVTSVTRLGRERSHRLFMILVAATYTVSVFRVFPGPLSAWTLLVLLSLPLALRLAHGFMAAAEVPPDADPQTAKVSTLFALLYLVALVMERAVAFV
jgi:1,4-dihydroxy-2-naphthoate octaprenyltransferase